MCGASRFDPNRKAIALVAGDKSGTSEQKFYRQLIAKADARFDAHLARLKRVTMQPRKTAPRNKTFDEVLSGFSRAPSQDEARAAELIEEERRCGSC